MKELELPAIDSLLILFIEFYKKGLTKKVIERAQFLYDTLNPARNSTLLSEVINSSIYALFPIAYPNFDPTRKPPTKKEVRNILLKLQRYRQGLVMIPSDVIIDFQVMKKELIELYESFLKNPENELIRKKIIAYDSAFLGLSGALHTPKMIEYALNRLPLLCQYGLWKDGHAFSNQNIISEAREILEKIKEQL